MSPIYCLVIGLVLISTLFSSSLRAGDTLVYVGTYTGKGSEGIYAYKLQDTNLTAIGLAGESANPSFLVIDPKRQLLFAANESSTFNGKPTGAVSAFSMDDAGKLTLINQQSSMGTSPCHLALDKSGRNLLVANYSSGSVAVLPVGDDGHLGQPSDVKQDAGKSVNPDRQEGPHAHCVTLDPTNTFAYVCDLGTDQVIIYRFDAAKGTLMPSDPAFFQTKPGAGPRHMVFGADGKFAYVINELASTITTLAFDPQNGALAEVQTISTLPDNDHTQNTAAEIAVHPSGKFLYASNRGRDNVVLFSIDPQKGTLTKVQEQSSGGKTPRHFSLSPAGDALLIANQDSHSLLLYRIDSANGQLKEPKPVEGITSPTCAVFFQK